jgi:uncharacterized protein YqhQ
LADSKILYGGQAVIEGVMMRGRRFVSCAVRRETGDITLHAEPIPSGVYAGAWSKIPFLRAATVLWDTLVLGTRMLMFSANLQVADELKKEEQEKEGRGEGETGRPGDRETGRQGDKPRDPHSGFETGRRAEGGQALTADPAPAPSPTGGADLERPLPPAAIYGTLAVSLALGIGLFFLLPFLVVAPFANSISPLASNVIEGVIRLALFLGYLLLISRIESVRRLFQYHGAEHKTIAAYEAGSELTPDRIQHYSKEHPRCGTGFLLTVVVVSIFVFALLGPLSFALRLASRVVLIPVVAALSYELIRFSSQHRNIFIFDWLVTRPSLWLQSLTTREPEPAMIDVAVAAFRCVQQQESTNRERINE